MKLQQITLRSELTDRHSAMSHWIAMVLDVFNYNSKRQRCAGYQLP